MNKMDELKGFSGDMSDVPLAIQDEAMEIWGSDHDETLEEVIEKLLSRDIEVDINPEPLRSAIEAKVYDTYEINRQSKENSGINQRISECAWANRGRYSPSKKQELTDAGEPLIYMRLTSARIRAAEALIKEILLTQKGQFSLVTKGLPDLPRKVRERLAKAAEQVNRVAEEVAKKEQEEQELAQKAEEQQKQQLASQQPGAQQQGQQLQQQPEVAQVSPESRAKLRAIEEAEERREVERVLLEQVELHTNFELKKVEKSVKQKLQDGKWDLALSSFIEDFCVFPTAIMRAPVAQSEKTIEWRMGRPVVKDRIVHKHVRVDPYDIYPSPAHDSLSEGDVVEHVRYTRYDLELFSKNAEGVIAQNLKDVINSGPESIPWFQANVESDRASEQNHGDMFYASKGIYHGLMFHGRVSREDMEEYGFKIEEMSTDVKAIVVQGRIVYLKVNNDPLGRRNYYSASYHNVPGSFWGEGIPELMEDCQAVCNATVRSLVHNMAFAKGPQAELYVDRLADAGDIESIHPLKIWQVKESLKGSGGRAVTFFSVPSIAQELLAVYQHFEARADDATGIPRYMYGSTGGMGGALETARGVGQMMAQANKNIKEVVRHIDEGLIKPRVKRAFYDTILMDDDLEYTGTIHVIALGSTMLAMKGAIEQKRLEFLQLTTNEFDMKTIGNTGRAKMLRMLADGCEFDEYVVPNLLDVKKREQEDKVMRQRELAAKEKLANKGALSLQATKMQVDGQREMNSEAQKTQRAKAAQDAQLKSKELEVKAADVQVKGQVGQLKAQADIAKAEKAAEASTANSRLKAAVDIKKSR